jgi:conjugal transfer pilus assembly protein TraE
MLIKTYYNHLQKLVRLRNSLVLGLGLSIALNLIQAIATVCLSHTTRTILVPTEVKEPMWVAEHKLSSEYLRQITDYFVGLFLNTTPESIPDKSNTILKYVHPSAYGEVRAYLQEEEKHMKHNQQARFFSPIRFEVDAKLNKVVVTGDEIHLIGKLEAFRERRNYEVTYLYQHGQLYLQAFRKLEGETHGS